jgi:hypothetical protein
LKNSINISSVEQLEEFFFLSSSDIEKNVQRSIIFYCEFSQQRGPKMNM